jgi:hypothetical protein
VLWKDVWWQLKDNTAAYKAANAGLCKASLLSGIPQKMHWWDGMVCDWKAMAPGDQLRVVQNVDDEHLLRLIMLCAGDFCVCSTLGNVLEVVGDDLADIVLWEACSAQ